MKTEQTKIEFGFGLQLTKTGKTILDHEAQAALRSIRSLTLIHFSGATCTNTDGAWRNAEGREYIERGCTLTVLTDVSHGPLVRIAVDEIVAEIKLVLQQEAVAVTLTPVNFSIL